MTSRSLTYAAATAAALAVAGLALSQTRLSSTSAQATGRPAPMVKTFVPAKPLGHCSYLVVSGNKAAVVDPVRDISIYQAAAKEAGATVSLVLLTHMPEDVVTGFGGLAAAEGATIVRAANAKTGPWTLGDVSFTCLPTPGHSDDSVCFLAQQPGHPDLLFAGDTLAIDSVGVPNAAPALNAASTLPLAKQMYQSIQRRIARLPDSTVIYPGHTAGALAALMPFHQTTMSSTLGEQRQTNFALKPDVTEAAFLSEVAQRSLILADSFTPLRALNEAGSANAPTMASVVSTTIATKAMDAAAIEAALKSGTMVVDTRTNHPFCDGHVPGTVFLGSNSSMEMWMGLLLKDPATPYVVIHSGDDADLKAVLQRFALVGFDNCVGYLKGGFPTWHAAGRAVDTIRQVKPDALAKELVADREGLVVDVRQPFEWNAAHVKGAAFRPLHALDAKDFATFPAASTIYSQCRTGYRSIVYITLARRNGSKADFVNIDGGFVGMQKEEGAFEWEKGAVKPLLRWQQ